MIEDYTTLDVRFEFDSQIINTRAYQGIMRSILKQVVVAQEKLKISSTDPIPDITSEDLLDTTLDTDISETQTILQSPSTTSEDLLDTNSYTDRSKTQTILHGPSTDPILDITGENLLDTTSDTDRSETQTILQSPSITKEIVFSDGYFLGWGNQKPDLTEALRCITCDEPISDSLFWCSRHHRDLPHMRWANIAEISQPSTGRSLSRDVHRSSRNQSLPRKTLRHIHPMTVREALPGSTPRNQQREDQISRDQFADGSQRKVLLLGSCQSGKSTTLKQLKILLEGKWSHYELESFKDSVFEHLIKSMKTILSKMKKLGLRLDMRSHVQTVFLEDLSCLTNTLLPEVTNTISILWKDAVVQEAFRRLQEYHLSDWAK